MSKKFLKIATALASILFCNSSCTHEKHKYDFVSIGNASIILKDGKIDTFIISVQSRYDYYSYLYQKLDTFTSYHSIEPTLKKNVIGLFKNTIDIKFLEYYYNEKLHVTYSEIMSDTVLYNELIKKNRNQLRFMTEYYFFKIDFYNDTSRVKNYLNQLNKIIHSEDFSSEIFNSMNRLHRQFLLERNSIQYNKILNIYNNNNCNKRNILFACSNNLYDDMNDLYIILKIRQGKGDKLVLENELINPELYNSRYYKYDVYNLYGIHFGG